MPPQQQYRPSLFVEGNLVPKGKDRKEMKEAIPIEYIVTFIAQRTPHNRTSAPRYPPKKMGDKVLALKSGTGSGKSASLAPEIYRRLYNRLKKNIGLLEPRVFNAVDIPTNIVKYYKFLNFDENIGYQTGPISRRPIRGIISMTYGILVQQFLSLSDDDIMDRYSHILIDEVHERTTELDNLLFYTKRFLETNWKDPRCPFFILMSATFDEKVFMGYFDIPATNYFEVKGQSYVIDTIYPPVSISNYIEYAADLVLYLHIKNLTDILMEDPIRDIIVFCHGDEVIKLIMGKINKFNKLLQRPVSEVIKHASILEPCILRGECKRGGQDRNYFLMPIHLNSKTFNQGSTEYKNLMTDPQYLTIDVGGQQVSPSRKIIISTNLAETGVTIDTLKYCIDTGYYRSVTFNPDYGVKVSTVSNVSHNMMIQRKGRVGRRAPGLFYPLYTEKTANIVPTDKFPSILSEDMTKNLLSIIIQETETEMISATVPYNTPGEHIKYHRKFPAYNTDAFHLQRNKPFKIASLDFLEFPSGSSINYSIQKLYGLGFIDKNYDCTDLGYYADRFTGMAIEHVRMLFAGYYYGANIMDIVTIIAFLTIGRRSIMPPRKRYKMRNPLNLPDEELLIWHKTYVGCEFIDMLFLWDEYTKLLVPGVKTTDFMQKVEAHLDRAGIKKRGLSEVAKIRDEIMERLVDLDMNPLYNGLGLRNYNLVEIMRKNANDGAAEIQKIKKCLIDAFRFNIASWNTPLQSYALLYKQLPLSTDSRLLEPVCKNPDLEQDRPMRIIVSDITYRESISTGRYEYFTGEAISVIDNLDIDFGFLVN